jgi:hypothetical protein
MFNEKADHCLHCSNAPLSSLVSFDDTVLTQNKKIFCSNQISGVTAKVPPLFAMSLLDG